MLQCYSVADPELGYGTQGNGEILRENWEKLQQRHIITEESPRDRNRKEIGTADVQQQTEKSRPFTTI